MPRIRTIKPEFFSSPSVVNMSMAARIAFIGLWCWADDTGIGTYRPRELAGFVFPFDPEITDADFRRLCAEIRRNAAVEFYRVAGADFYRVPSWEKHQSKHSKISDPKWHSKFPSPEEGEQIDPESLQVIDIVPEICRNSADSARNLPRFG